MLKSKAIELLGGSVASTAKTIGVSYQAVDKWPERLPQRIADRVLAALARRHLPANLIGEDEPRQPTPVAQCPSSFAPAGVQFGDLPERVRRAVAGGR